MQIWQNNICNTNIIVIEDVIIATEKNRENRGLLAMENVDKTAIPVAKVLSAIDFDNKYN